MFKCKHLCVTRITEELYMKFKTYASMQGSEQNALNDISQKISSRTIFVPCTKRTSENLNLRFQVKRNELRQLIWLIKLKPRGVKYQNPGSRP